jgi:hypothetical protein
VTARTIVIDDHLLRDWLANPDRDLTDALRDATVATTNLWYARLCKSAARAGSGALLARWGPEERRALVASLVALPGDVVVLPMRDLAWRMGELVVDHSGLSTLGAEAVAAAIELDAAVLVSSRDDGPGIRRCCELLRIEYDTLAR